MNKSFFAEILTRKPELVTSMLHFNSFQQSSTTPNIIMPNTIKNLAQYGIDVEKLWNAPLIRKKYLSQYLVKNIQEQNTKNFENTSLVINNVENYVELLDIAENIDIAENAEHPMDFTENAEHPVELLDIAESMDITNIAQESPSFTYWDFAEESKRLALINQNTLQELIIYLGTVFNAEEIAQCIEREKVLSIKKIIGLEAYAYALGRGQFQFGNKKIIIEIFPSFIKECSFSKRIIMQGVCILYLCTQGWTEGLRQSLYNKIIPTICENRSGMDINIEEFKTFLQEFSFDDVSQATKRHAWFSLKKMLTKELAPSCLVYFD